MGQAKRKREKLAAMSGADKVRMCAKNLFERHMIPFGHMGACYFTTFLLHHHLATRHNVITRPVVGFLNDRTDRIWWSHAWLEYEDKVTDLAVFLPDDHGIGQKGSARIMGDIVAPSDVDCRYELEEPADAMTAEEHLTQILDKVQKDEFAKIWTHKKQEHERMKQLAAGSLDAIYSYLAAAPRPSYSYYASLMG